MSIKRAAIAGVKWTTISTVALTATNLIKISILARLLDKSDFGQMALVTFFLGFMNLFMDLGLSTAILHFQHITKSEYSSLYWINIISSLILVILIIVISPIIASFYMEPELKRLIPLMSISIVISSLGRQFRTTEQKKLNFRYIAIAEICGVILGVSVAIITAYMGYGVYALIYGTLVQYAVINFIFLFKGIKSKSVHLHFNFHETKPFLKIGMYQVGGQVVNYFSRDLDIIFIGKIMGTEVLGGYSLAKQFVRRPMQIFNPIVIKVATSIFPKYQSNNSMLRKYFSELLKSSGVLYSMVYGSIAILSPQLVLIFFGQDLISLVIYVKLFSIVLFFRSLGSYVGILVVTKGRTDYDFFWNILVILFVPIVILFGARYSIETIIVMLGILQLFLLVPGWYFFYFRLIRMRLKPYLEASLAPFLIAGLVVSLNEVFVNKAIIGEILIVILLLFLLIIYSYRNLDRFRNTLHNYLLKKTS